MSKEYFTVKEYGLRRLQKDLEEGYRVIIKAKKIFKCENQTILSGTVGEILEIDVDAFFGIPEEFPLISKVVWYKKGLQSENIKVEFDSVEHQEENLRLEDLIIVDFPLKLVSENPRQLRLFE